MFFGERVGLKCWRVRWALVGKKLEGKSIQLGRRRGSRVLILGGAIVACCPGRRLVECDIARPARNELLITDFPRSSRVSRSNALHILALLTLRSFPLANPRPRPLLAALPTCASTGLSRLGCAELAAGSGAPIGSQRPAGNACVAPLAHRCSLAWACCWT